MSSDFEARITELEMRLAFQDDAIQALSDELVAQRSGLDRLQRQLELLAKRQAELRDGLEPMNDQPPPHY